VNQFVVDASAAFEFLLKTPLGLQLRDLFVGADLVAPELLDVEVLSALRRLVLLGRVDESIAVAALADLPDMPIVRLPHRLLTRLAWQYRHNISAYDSMYVAAARLYGYPLITTDGPLSRATGIDIVVHHVRLA
jgi:predicted nucleic acid-binding protein